MEFIVSEFYAFIDESGDPSLSTDKQGVSKYYSIAAVVTEENHLEALEQSIDGIRKKYYGNGEIKSSNTDDARRLRVIEALLDVRFHFRTIAVDKDAIYRDSGLVYKQSFIKFISGLLYRSLVRSYPDVDVRADQHGREEFMAEFRTYIRENHVPDLFRETKLTHVRSHECILVQLADFLAGTARKMYEGTTSKEVCEAFLNLLKKKKLTIDEWPPRYASHVEDAPGGTEHDTVVRRIAMDAAAVFILDNQERSDLDTHFQLLVLKYLLSNAKYGHGEYISGDEILDHLATQGFGDMSSHQLKSSAISRLRDSNVLISSSNKGYKIPLTYRDFMDFVELVDGQTLPLLERLGRACRSLNDASLGELDALDNPRFERLRRIIESL
ncbi:MAG: DUF3800 domain-containing protein [Limisphaerales bacterium]